jgi:hypothetical protein
LKKRTVYFILFLGVCFTVNLAQTTQQLRTQVTESEKNKDWYSAFQYYSRLYPRDSTNLKLQYRFAEASRLCYELDVALYFYNRIARIDNGSRFPLTFYWIGQILKSKQRYKDARKWFNKFYKMNLKKTKYNYYKAKAKLEMEACDLAQIMMANPVTLSPEHLDATINSKQSEYGAFEKDSALYFSSIRVPDKKPIPKDAEEAQKEAEKPYYSKIYRSEIKNQKWRKIKALDTIINSNYLNNANTCFNSDYTKMVISRCTALNASDYSCELFISEFKNNKWLAPVKISDPVNQPSVSTTQANFGEIEGKTVLFFSSNRAGGEGGYDIWYSFMDKDGNFEKPINAGKKINTPDDEITPWFVSDKKTLFFSSTYHKGFGGVDIFRSALVNNEFFEPENVGYPVNSSHNDLYYSQSKDALRLYLSSNRNGSFFEGKQNCCYDIYKFTIHSDTAHPVFVVDTVHIMKEQMKLLVPLTLYFHNDEPDPKTKNVTTTKNYETTYNDYKAMEPLYIKEYSRGLKGDVKNISENKVTNFFSDSLDGGIEGLRRFSDLLEKVLRNGETVKITMKGYCSPLASTDYNILLAKRRISSLRNYFMETKNGLFAKYVNNAREGEGKIIFEDVDVGELPKSKVSDDVRDIRNAVFSPLAASERKIQIIAVSYGSRK